MAKILFVTSNFLPPESYNGMAITLVSLARALSRRGHDLTVLAAGHGAAARHRDRAGVEKCLFSTTGEILRSLHANADALCVWHVGGQFPHPNLFKRRHTLSYIYVHALGLGNEHGVVAINGRLGGRMSYLANSGFTQRRLHAAFDLATPIVPIFAVPEDYRVDSARRHVVFVNPSRAKGGARVLAMARVLPETVAAGGVVMAADAPLAGWCSALVRMWDDRAHFDRAAAMAPMRAPETVLD